MITECKYNELTGNSQTLHDCERCSKEFDFPYHWCCCNVCGELVACVKCKVRERVFKEIEK